MAVKPLVGAQLDRSHPLAQGLAGLWLMNEGSGLSVYDYSGNDNHGVLVNGPTWAAGKDGWAVSFDGTNDYVLATSPVGLPSGDVPRTLFARSYWTSIGTAAGYCIGGYGNAANGKNFQLSAASFNANFWVLGWGGNYDWNTGISATSLAAGWHTYAVTYDGSSTILHIDGTARATTSAFAWDTNPQRVVIGREIDLIGHEYTGLIGDFSIYDRALTADEVAWLTAEPYCMFARPDRWLRWIGSEVVLLTVTDSLTVADSAAFTHCMTLADAVVLIDTDAFMHLLTIADNVGLAEADTYRHDVAPADSVTLSEAIALLHRLGVADAVKLSPSVSFVHYKDRDVTVTDALVCRDGITLTKLLTVQDLVLLRQLVRAITPCSGGYFENDDQQSNLYQEMV